MRDLKHGIGVVVGLLVVSTLCWAGTPGSFRGKIVEKAPSAPVEKNWIYVEGRNGMVRRVEISHARVEYDEDVPREDRGRAPREVLIPGAEVRITAEQGSDGEWKASEVEILALSASEENSATAHPSPHGSNK